MKNLEDIKKYEESKNSNSLYNSEYVTYLKSKQAQEQMDNNIRLKKLAKLG